MGLVENFTKPEYIFHPAQIVHRLRRSRAGSPRERETVDLPWGLPLTVYPAETIGRLIWNMGVFELSVTEALWRLVEPGETVVDVGANIGYMTSILALRSGREGTVHAFEPHPDVFRDLEANVDGWSGREVARVTTHRMALGAQRGTARLAVEDSFDGNRGLARIDDDAAGRGFDVEVRTLDDVLGAGGTIGVLKVDVEGHEDAVLQGAAKLLEAGRIRDIIFEEHRPYPSPVTDRLERAGYTILALRQRLWGVAATGPREVRRSLRVYETQNFVATCEVKRALSRLRPLGWRSLRR